MLEFLAEAFLRGMSQLQLCAMHSKKSVTYTVKNGALRYTLIGVVEEWPLQHPCLAPIFSSKNAVECIPHCGQIGTCI